MEYIIVVLLSYIVGSSSMSYYISKMKGINMKQNGSKNLGASNTVVLVGWKAGILVAVHDVLKGALAVMAARYFYPDLALIAPLAGVACVLGHIFPFYLKFDGGKGFASYVGMTLALNWKLGLAIIIVAAIITIVTDYIVCGTMTTVAVVPAYFAFATQDYLMVCVLLVASLVMVYKHRENFVRIMNGTEIGLRKVRK